MSEPTTDQVLFEALFVRALEVSGPFEQELKKVGFDLHKPLAKYPSEVFRDCLNVARRTRFPELPPAEGIKSIGQLFVGGFRQTILGKVMTVALPILGPRRMLSKIPGRLQRLRTDLEVRLEQTGKDAYALHVRDPVQVGDFFAGVLEAALELAGARVEVNAIPRADGYTLPISFAALSK